MALAIFVLTDWPESRVATVGIPAAAAVGAAFLVPLMQFFWRLLWQPWNDIKAKVTNLAEDEGHMGESERLIVVLRNYLRQGFELEPYRKHGASTYSSSELDELEDWTHSVVTCLTEYGTKAQCEKFIEADKLCPSGYAAHREWALARIGVLEAIIEELDPSSENQSSSAAISSSDQT
ncbi:MAG: hypothetical protein WDZ46_04500 [Solirubrobacterales bacterium]